MRKLRNYIIMAASLMAMMPVTALAAPIKQEEIDTLIYGGVIMGGVVIYLGVGKLWNKFMSGRQENAREKEKEE